jgi:hypothetical protein
MIALALALAVQGDPKPFARVIVDVTQAEMETVETELEFFARPGAKAQKPRYRVRKIIMPPRSPGWESWADSASCPALNAVVAKLANLDLSRLGPPPRPSSAPGATLYTLVRDGAQAGSGAGSPLAAWHDMSVKQLDGCWSERTVAR